ncbi:hypothetical protein [Burkholderia contaminans]|uniref:Glycosyltransferase family 1 protein n=1 Tax=Burkholderia contaminans TaxID=488447 RepID=A0A6P2ZXH9_9BURK|nr:hypothetical protein [Burkholderia contaminans]VWD35429.1 hypothetical protein BCO71171_04244 [Burkholderia contaminans]
MENADFIICAPLYMTFKSNGVLALARLAQAIEKAGRSAYMCTYEFVDGREVILGIDYDTYQPKNDAERQIVGEVLRAVRTFDLKLLKDFSQRRVDECYVVYPEVMVNNALNARNVIRYFLNKDNPGRRVNVGERDFILAHSRVMHPDPHHVCYFADVNPLFHNNSTYPAELRQMDIAYIGKGALYGAVDSVPETVLITREWPASKEQLAIMLRNCRFFYTADACSNLNVEALACGAIPAFMDNGPWTDEEIDGAEPGTFPRLYAGIEAGDDFYARFEEARAKYFENLRGYIDGWDAGVAEMIGKADRHFAGQTGPHADAPALGATA